MVGKEGSRTVVPGFLTNLESGVSFFRRLTNVALKFSVTAICNDNEDRECEVNLLNTYLFGAGYNLTYVVTIQPEQFFFVSST